MDEHTVDLDKEASTTAGENAKAHSTAPAANEREPKRESLAIQDAGPNIKWTPTEAYTGIDSQYENLLQGTPTFSQDPCLQPSQIEMGSLQQEMERNARISHELEQVRAQEAAAALRGVAASPSAAVAADLQPGHAGHDIAQGALVDIKPNIGGDTAAAAASGPDDLLQLAAAAALEQQQDQAAGFRDQNMQQYDPSTLAAMQQYDPSWAAAYAGMPMGMMNMNYYWPTGCMPGQYPQQKHPSLTKPEHQSSTAKRRGPMDEMRQLQRILTKLLPGSIIYMPNQDGGGNKVQADDIKVYLAATLGEAPKPDWGLKNGWAQYLADLFNWATGREGDAKITNMEAMDCARRPQGRSWEVVFDKLMELGIYSWNWELPLRHEQVLNCQKSPPPELTRQQEALAAATAAAAAAAAVTAGTTPDAIPNLPVVARMASLLGKRQRHQMGPMPPMPTMPMVQPGMMYGGTPTAAAAAAAPVSVEAASVSGGEEAGSVMAPGAAAAAAAGGGGEAGVEAAGAEERPAVQQRSGSAGPSATDAPGTPANGGAAAAAAAAAGAGAGAVAGGGVGGNVSPGGDAAGSAVITNPEEAASVEQLLTIVNSTLSRAVGVLQTMVLSGNAHCPSMEYISYIKNFQLNPMYHSFMSLVEQAATQQAAMLQHMQQQATLQEAKIKVKAEAAARSSRGAAAAADPAAAAAAPVALPAAYAATYAAASSAGSQPVPPAAAVGVSAVSEGDSDAALAAAAAAAGAAAAAAMALAQAPAAAGSKGSGGGAVALAAKALKKKGGRASRESQQPDLAQLAQQQNAVQAAAEEAARAATAAAQQRGQQQQASSAAAAAGRLGWRGLRDSGAEGSNVNSEEAVQAAALALTTLHNSPEVLEDVEYGQQQQQQYQPAGDNRQQMAAAAAALQKRRVGGSRLSNGSSRALNNSPSKAR